MNQQYTYRSSPKGNQTVYTSYIYRIITRVSLGESFSTGIIWNQSVGFWGPNAYYQLIHPHRKPNVFSTISQIALDMSLYMNIILVI